MPRVSFYFDLGSPYGYLAAERLGSLLPEPVEWTPVLLGGLFKLAGRSSWAVGDHRRRQTGIAEVERRAKRYGLPPLRWPDPWPADYLAAMRAATFAFAVGRGHEFTLHAYRSAFQQGADLSQIVEVIRAGREAGLDAEGLERALADPEVKASLRDATDAAFAAGVTGVPTIAIDGETFWGDDRLEDAAAHLASVTEG
jgi:2-hydroxychromene-2-carboxylate isomerase